MTEKIPPDLLKISFLEDLEKSGDLSSNLTIPRHQISIANIYAKESGVISGVSVIKNIFEDNSKVSCKIIKTDGSFVQNGDIVITLQGSTQEILKFERTCLNFLQHLSGISNLTSKFVEIAKKFNVAILDTRKTLPGLRSLEKKAVIDGGGKNHRFGLFDAILLKENHIKACGSITSAIDKIKSSSVYSDLKVMKNFFIEVEVSNFIETKECCLLPEINIIMLDNMSATKADRCIQYIRKNSPNKKIEISGNINLKNLKKYAALRPDRISVGKITHSAPAFDFSLLLI